MIMSKFPTCFEQIRARRGAAGLLNLDRILLHSHTSSLPRAGTSLHWQSAPRPSACAEAAELAICTVAILNRAEYATASARAGVDQDGSGGPRAASTLQRCPDSTRNGNSMNSTPSERAVIDLTVEMTRQISVSRAQLWLRARTALASSIGKLIELARGDCRLQHSVAHFWSPPSGRSRAARARWVHPGLNFTGRRRKQRVGQHGRSLPIPAVATTARR